MIEVQKHLEFCSSAQIGLRDIIALFLVLARSWGLVTARNEREWDEVSCYFIERPIRIARFLEVD